MMALSDVAKARGFAQLTKKSGLGRETLYKALPQGSKPRSETIVAFMRAMNVKLEVVVK
jgi:probable addiction module antidote protein